MKGLTKEATEIIQQYEDGKAYKKRMGFYTKWPEYERFKAGDQWPAATPRTQMLPRPVFNIIELIESHKVSSVMNEHIKMVFSTDEEQFADAADLFSRFSETTWERVKQDDLNEEALEDASNRGTCVMHYYWDNDIKGGNTVKYQGDMCGEVIDPMNWFPGNPQQRDMQKQPYHIITYRDLLENVRAKAKAAGLSQEMVNQIQPDKDTQDEGYDMAKVELTDSEKVTVILKYYREKGYVYFTEVAAGLVIRKPVNTTMKRYPLAALQWKRRKKSAFGVGDTEGLIPNQKSINFLMAMQVLSVQLTGWPKLIYKSGAIDPNKVTNAPGEMIQDNSAPGNEGVRYLTPGSTTSQAQMLVEKFIEYTREMTGANDAATGEAPSAQLNATAIMLLQKASGVPIESIKRRFYQFVEDIGRIWEEFWKVKYNINRLIQIKDDEGNPQTTMFNGEAYKDIDMHLKIDIGPSSTYSESLMMSSLDRMLDGQYITFDQYLKFAPKNVVPFKERLLKDIERQREQEAQQPQVDPMQQAQMQMEMQQQQEDRKFMQQAELKQMDHEAKLQLEAMKLQGKQYKAN